MEQLLAWRSTLSPVEALGLWVEKRLRFLSLVGSFGNGACDARSTSAQPAQSPIPPAFPRFHNLPLAHPSRTAAKQAGKAGLRLGGVFALFTAARGGVEAAGGPPALASLVAGAVAVAVPSLGDTTRTEFLLRYYRAMLGPRVPVGLWLVVTSAAVSGAVTVGGLDIVAQRALGLKW